MAGTRKMKKAGRRKTARRGGAYKNVATACKSILNVSSEKTAIKIFEDAMGQFSDRPAEELDVLNLCLRTKTDTSLLPEARAKVAELSKGTLAPKAPEAPKEAEPRSTTPSTVTGSEGEEMMDIDYEAGPAPFVPTVIEGGPMELDGGRKKRKTRKGGRKHKKVTRRH